MGGEPFGKFDHLYVLQADAGVDVAADDGLGDVHAAADGGVVVGGHAVVLGEFVDLDLLRVRWCMKGVWMKTNLSELANVSDLLALQGAEVLGDSAVLEVDDTGEGLVEQRTDRGNGEVTGFGLLQLTYLCP